MTPERIDRANPCPHCHVRLWEKGKHNCPGPAQRGAYFKGFKAWLEFGKKARCPYKDKRGDYHNMVTFSQGFINWWTQGFEDAKRENGIDPF